MKKQSLFYNIICVLALTACSSSTRYVISGTVPEDLNGKYIYMLRNGNFRYGERNTNLDSAWVENGKFRFIGNVEGNAVRFISTSQQAFTFILEPGEIMFDITDEMSLKGTPLNDELTQYRKALKGVEEKYREINEAVKADPAFVKTERFRTMNEEARQMKKGICTLYYITVVTSTLVGLWHFFVPWMFQWYDYLPMQYENLVVGIDYTNYCFSLLLFGLSVMLIILGKRALDLNKEVIYFYYFLTVVWLFRACLATFIEPWPLEPIPAAAIGQLIASDLLAALMLFVSVRFIKAVRRK